VGSRRAPPAARDPNEGLCPPAKAAEVNGFGVADELHGFHAMSILVAALALVLALLLSSPTSAMGDPAQASRAGLSPVCLTPTSFAELATAARAAVVVIRPAGDMGPFEEVLDNWLETEWDEGDPTKRDEMREQLARALRERSFGSGVIVDPSGIVVTSARIVRFLAHVQAVMADGARSKLTVVGVDDRSDIAVLQLEPRPAAYPHLRLGDSDEVRTGDWILAVGAPFGFDFSVAAGIVSSTARDLPGTSGPLLQTDASGGSGNLGGPLVNLTGEVIGIMTVPTGRGIGFATPSNTVRRIATALRTTGRVSRAWLGVAVQPLTPDVARVLGRAETSGILVVDVPPRSAAAQAGVRRRDLLLGLDGAALNQPDDLERALARLAANRPVTLRLWRDGREQSLQLTLGEEPTRRVPDAEGGARALGLTVAPVTPEAGVVVTHVAPGSAADKHGVHRGDVVREIDGRAVPTLPTFARVANGVRPGQWVLVLLQPGSDALYVALTPTP
jgi:serine protease Do